MSKSETAELWAERLRRFDLTDLTVAAFCAAEGVSEPSYYHWRRKLRGPVSRTQPIKASPTAALLPVTLAPQAGQLEQAS